MHISTKWYHLISDFFICTIIYLLIIIVHNSH